MNIELSQNSSIIGIIQIQVLLDGNNFVIQARMLKKANVHVEEDLSKRTRENRAELRKFMRQVCIMFTQDL